MFCREMSSVNTARPVALAGPSLRSRLRKKRLPTIPPVTRARVRWMALLSIVLATLLATFSIGVLLQEVVKLVFGSEFRGYNWPVGKIDLGVTILPTSKLLACLGSVAIAVLLYLWFNRTRAGSAMRSVVEDSEGARVCGVNVGAAYAWSFALGIGLTVTSGVLLTMFIPVGIN